jgi:hypothetical protein
MGWSSFPSKESGSGSDAGPGEDISHIPDAPPGASTPSSSLPEPFTQDDDFFPAKKPEGYPTYHNYRRDREAARLKAQGHSLDDIAEALHLTDSRTGEPDPARAGAAVRRGLANVHQFTVDEKRHEQLHSLEMMKRHLWDQLEHPHVMVQQGRVIMQDGLPLEDRRFVLEVMDRLSKIEDQTARLIGTNATTRLSVEADQIGGEIVQLISMIGDVTQGLPDAPAPAALTPASGGDDDDG